MLDLTQYGFLKIKETEKWDEYENHDIIITIYHYGYMTFDNKEIMRNTFVVSSKTTTSPSFHISELESWLRKNKINKIIT